MTTPRTRTTPVSKIADRSPVALDLDSLERENAPKPFTIRLGGRKVTLIDLRDLDWQEAAALSPDRPFQFVEAVVAEEDQEFFLSQKISLWKMENFASAYRTHYGLGDEGNSRG